jgi:ABC-type branched-subunit amino acid transport system ATPase component
MPMGLRVENVVAGYGDKSIIDCISFEVVPGQIMALFGHNGAGKSTTLKAILGLIPISEGAVWLDDQRIDRLSVTQRIKRGLRLLPEGRGIFPDLTVAENLRVVGSAHAASSASDLQRARCKHERRPAADARFRPFDPRLAALYSARRAFGRPAAGSRGSVVRPDQ